MNITKIKYNMEQYISKSDLITEIERKIRTEQGYSSGDAECGYRDCAKEILSLLDTFEAIDPYEQCVQYDSIKAGIQAHAETYSFNIESELFNQLTKEQQKLWRKEIEQAVISGGDTGYLLAKDTRYKENHEVKEVDINEEAKRKWDSFSLCYDESRGCDVVVWPYWVYKQVCKHFFKLGLKAQKGE